MNDLLKSIAPIIGGSAVLGVVIFGILWIVRGAVATAITQAASRELVRLRGEIDADLQAKKDAAGLALEQFRTQLTMEAEIRRQTAARRVEALLKISDATIALQRAFFNTTKQDDISRNDRFNAVIAWGHQRVEVEVLFGVDALPVLAEFQAAAIEVNSALGAWDLTQPPRDPNVRLDAEQRIDAARVKLFQWVRRELQIASPSGRNGQ